jgi:hypothetical protein
VDEPFIHDAARRHGVPDEDIRHALRNHHAVWSEQGDAEVTMFVGPAWDGALLEVGVLLEQQLVIHAMPARRKYWPRPR